MSKKRERSNSNNSIESDYSESDLEIQEILGTLTDLSLDKPLNKKSNKGTRIIESLPRKMSENDINESINNLNSLVDSLFTEIGIRIKSNNESTISIVLTECLTLFDDNYKYIEDSKEKEAFFINIGQILRRIYNNLNNNDANYNIITERINNIHEHMLEQLHKTYGGGQRYKKMINKKKNIKK